MRIIYLFTLLILSCFFVSINCSEFHYVETSKGKVLGKQTESNLVEYLGIRYAQPPTGAYRFQPPQDLETDSYPLQFDSVSGSQPGNDCPQPSQVDGKPYGDEDCLFLNVWTPAGVNNTSNLPVFFFIHGGGLFLGTGYDRRWGNPYRYASEHNIVAVTLNYRLGLLGFLALEALDHADQRGISGNYGFLDQLKALQWVQDNIKQFGGDPNQVTIGGQSAGGFSVLALTSSKLSEGLFQRGIAMSAAPGLFQTQKEASKDNLKAFVPNTACKGMAGNDLIKCLYQLDWEDFVTGLEECPDCGQPYWGFPKYPQVVKYPLAVVDGYFLDNSFNKTFKNDLNQKVDLIISWLTEEIDLSPSKVILDYSKEQYQDLVTNYFDQFKKGLGSQVYNLYPFENYDNPQQGYDQISSEIAIGCQLISHVQSLAKNLEKHNKNVYMYISPQRPQYDYCSNQNYCARYAYHGFDQISSFNDSISIQLGDSDLQFGNNIRWFFADFIRNGYISDPAWMPYQYNQNITWLQYPEPELIPNPKIDKCNFWSQNGFDQWEYQL
ncbi:carboxylesterase [Anaeramoeba flamelloides]|uniref:Carboxylic ester hydrolase n=1 Tax=Anaeramoeba flamelloides TaxID=1746091 RepID=A0AAV7ZX43_9EUKA|nr:carboxylesterase [Anaeramoeba flamelloides]